VLDKIKVRKPHQKSAQYSLLRFFSACRPVLMRNVARALTGRKALLKHIDADVSLTVDRDILEVQTPADNKILAAITDCFQTRP
jgi:hypothetical protein